MGTELTRQVKTPAVTLRLGDLDLTQLKSGGGGYFTEQLSHVFQFWYVTGYTLGDGPGPKTGKTSSWQV